MNWKNQTLIDSVEPRLLKEPRGGVPDVIDTKKAFDAMVERFAQADGPVAADAERASGFRYGQEDWLVQFKRNGAGIALFDPIALEAEGVNWEDFNDAVKGADWIIHDSLQDLPGFFALGMRPSSVFDTEVAARLIGNTRFGLASVTAKYLGLVLSKEHSAADWSYRPLPRDWRNYAALDVEVLIELRARLLDELRGQGKLEWAREEFSYLLDKGGKPRVTHPEPWRRVSHITALNHDPRGLAVVRSLWTVRDRYARELDIAPTLLLSDAAMIEAGERKPHNSKQFKAIRSLNERVRMHTDSEQDKMFERYAPLQRRVKPAVWRQAVLDALALSRDELPTTAPKPMNEDVTNAPRSMKYWRVHHPERFARLQAVRQVIAQIGEDTHTPIEVLLKPQIVRNLCWKNPRPEDIRDFLKAQGARNWQISLIAESVSRVTI
ncbi:ribonuclease D [Bifidobacterium sp. SMB2]|uniref:Ribonuclease D n=1 Tax=Bifidobacterium saimiriisciurei TaxID=2661627 RepID=A0ABX0CCQ1_9BIFI|nr:MULTISPECIES: HRDC domain-containing protein [Bifidobacterium]NEG95882.1 ribonuclease D [Bifidobacterium sp. SMB2]NEH12049.1 ribonuclease D [Bifidobacterium saimiriisciurei]